MSPGGFFVAGAVAEDEAGNTATASVQVHVPLSNDGEAIDDGPLYEVEGTCGSKSSALANGTTEDDGLLINYPNPFQSSTTFKLTTRGAGHYLVKIYNLQGVEISTLLDEEIVVDSARRLTLDATDLREGIYLAVLFKDDRIVTTKKLIRMN